MIAKKLTSAKSPHFRHFWIHRFCCFPGFCWDMLLSLRRQITPEKNKSASFHTSKALLDWCFHGWMDQMNVSENSGFSPNHPMFNRGFHEINHPFWGISTPIFGNTHLDFWHFFHFGHLQVKIGNILSETNSEWKHLTNGWLEMLEDDPFRFLLGFGPFCTGKLLVLGRATPKKLKSNKCTLQTDPRCSLKHFLFEV